MKYRSRTSLEVADLVSVALKRWYGFPPLNRTQKRALARHLDLAIPLKKVFRNAHLALASEQAREWAGRVCIQRQRWGPGPLFIDIILRCLGEKPPADGEEIRKYRQRLARN
jgi:hypothetical protein